MHASNPKKGTWAAVALLCCALVASPAAARDPGKWEMRDDLFSVSFPAKEQGWACGRFGTILHTADGGAAWERQESGTACTLTSLHFIDALGGWAVGSTGTILHTEDGGKTWVKQESPVGFYHMCVTFLTPQKGFIASERTHILATEDGGRTWQVRFRDTDFILKSISFCDDRHGWAVGEFGYIYRTTDGGQTWQQQAGLYELDDATGDLKGEAFLYSVVALEPETAWAVGIQGTVKQTSDGGATWEDVNLNLPPVQLYCIGWDGRDTLAIAGRGVCVVSTDRGRNWRSARFEPSIEYSWIYGISLTGRRAACGDEGSIYFTGSEGWLRAP
ncbi:MAG: YCF48-related protein [bacterium]